MPNIFDEDPMENPFTSRVARLEEASKRLSIERQDWIRRLDCHRTFRPDEAHLDLGRLKRDREATQAKLGVAVDRCARLDPEQARLQALASAGLNPRWWFSSERTVAKRQLAVVNGEADRAHRDRDGLQRSLASSDLAIQALGERIHDHHSFDPLRAVASIDGIQRELEVTHLQAQALRERRDDLDDRLGNLLPRLSELRHKQALMERDIATAERYDAALTNAGDPRERAILHEECAAKLGDSKPKRIVSRQRAALAPLAREIDKLSRRIAHIIAVASVEIEHLIIDGNNLCYAQGEFIGLDALQALIPELVDRYKVTVVFDAGIRGMLKCRDAEIRAAFPAAATVHVVASGAKADEVVLEKASDHPRAYAISNDRFVDYPDKAAMTEQRLLRHEIVGGRVGIIELGVWTSYGEKGGAAHGH